MMNKSLGVSLLVASVNAIRRMEDEAGATGDAPADNTTTAVVAVPFVETGGFLAIVIVVAVLALCCLCCCVCTIGNK